MKTIENIGNVKRISMPLINHWQQVGLILDLMKIIKSVAKKLSLHKSLKVFSNQQLGKNLFQSIPTVYTDWDKCNEALFEDLTLSYTGF